MRLILHAGQRLKQNHKDVFLPAHPLEPYLLGKEFGPMLSQENIQSPMIQCRRNLSIFEWILEIKRLSSEQSSFVWRQVEEMHCKRRRKEKYFSVVLILQEKFFTCELFKDIQDVTLLIHHYRTTLSFRDDFFKYNYHIGCVINLHSIMNSGLIPAGQKIEHKTDSILPACESCGQRTQRSWEIDLKAPRHAQYMQTAWKKNQNTVYSVDINLAQKNWLKFYQTRSNAIIFHNTLRSLLYPDGYSDGNWRNVRKSIWITLTASEDVFEKWLDERIGFRSCSTSRRLPTNPTKSQSNS